MRISDWSSDVCSSDLLFAQTADLGTNRLNRQSVIRPQHRRAENLRTVPRPVLKRFLDEVLPWNDQATLIPDRDDDIGAGNFRSEERRVGKECVGQFKPRW